MTPAKLEIAALRQRVAAAQSRRGTWRLAGDQERYLEACSMVDALDLQLSRLEKAEHERQAAARS
jgi:hypothetical protein